MKYFTRGFLLLFLLLFGATLATAQEEPTPLNVFYGEIPQADRIVFVAPDGDNTAAGTEEEPWATLPYAVSQIRRGEVIVMRGGVYHHSTAVSIQSPNGFIDQLITLTAYPGEVPILDFSTQPKERNYHGIRLNANFWHVIGITVRYASHNGIRMDGSYNILEQVTSYGNHDTGIHLAGGASNNLILNTDSFHNFNYDTNRTPRIGNNADGFGVKFSGIGPNNRFYGCRAFENSDDGFDFWEAPSTIVIENSWAFGNGDAEVFGNPANFEGNGNGFKLGGNYVSTPHVVLRSMAFDNFGASGNAKGFDFNNNPGAMTLKHNTAFNNGRNYWFPLDPPGQGQQAVFINNLSVQTNLHAGTPPNAVVAGNSWQQPTPVTTDMFLSVDTTPAKGPREQDGSLPDIDLLKPAPGSLLVDGGVAIAEPFYGSAPDIGARPLEDGELVDPFVDRGSGAIVSDLIVYDMEHAEHWAIRNEIEPGETAFADADYTVASVPAYRIDEWIQTPFSSRSKNYLFTTAEFSVNDDTHVFVAHADQITNKPSWLAAFEETDRKMTLSDGEGTEREMTVYAKEVQAGQTVVLGRNSASAATTAPMYLVMLGAPVGISTEETPDVPADFVLHGNYPNPFNNETTISFELAKNTNVSIRIYDVMGREVAELANGNHQPGLHKVVWNASSFASGVYYTRMVAGDVTEVTRLIIAR